MRLLLDVKERDGGTHGLTRAPQAERRDAEMGGEHARSSIGEPKMNRRGCIGQGQAEAAVWPEERPRHGECGCCSHGDQ
jgi:hypothetical protein